jgi:hypothetical protein
MAGELRAMAVELPGEHEELGTMACGLHAMADRVQAEWEVLHTEWCALRAREHALHPRALIYHVFRELYLALCRRDHRYGQEVAALGTDATLLVAAIAAQVARRGFPATAVSAVAATVLWLMAKLGVGAFCDFYAPHFAASVT